jgi:hypothetical protein
MKAPIATAVAIMVGLIILAGYFVTVPELQQLRAVLLGWGVVLLGVAALVGVLNLASVHWKKMTAARGRDYYSVFFLIAFAATLAAGFVLGPWHPQFRQVVLSIQAPVEASLLAVLAVSMVIMSIRLFQQRRGFLTVVFLLSVVVFLALGSGLLQGQAVEQPAEGLSNLLNNVSMAGARGILLGVALGSLATGLRILMGADRPYTG